MFLKPSLPRLRQPDAMKNLLCFELRAFYDELFRSVYGLRFCVLFYILFLKSARLLHRLLISAPRKKYHFYSSIWMSNEANHNEIVLK